DTKGRLWPDRDARGGECGLVEQECKESYDRRGFRPSAVDTGRSRCEGEANGAKLAREHLDRLPVRMLDHKPQQNLAGVSRARLRAICRFRAEGLDMNGGEVGEVALTKQHARPRQQRVRGALGLAYRIDADNRDRCDRTVAVLMGRGYFVLGGRRLTVRAAD